MPIASDPYPKRENISKGDYQSFPLHLNDALENMKPLLDQLETLQDLVSSVASELAFR